MHAGKRLDKTMTMDVRQGDPGQGRNHRQNNSAWLKLKLSDDDWQSLSPLQLHSR